MQNPFKDSGPDAFPTVQVSSKRHLQHHHATLAEGGAESLLSHNSASFTTLRTLGGTPNRDPCSLRGLMWGLPRDIGVI